ncbi:MAG: DUF1684 domain-containing protein [Saprospiraceae bacterium]
MKYLLLILFLPINLLAQTSYTEDINAHREHYKQEFLEDERAPLKASDTADLRFYLPDPDWKIPAKFELTPDAEPFDISTYSGKTKKYRQYGLLHFERDGAKYTLGIYQSLRLIELDEYKDYLFLPFKDFTNGEETYGGGRYMDFKLGDISDDGMLMLDFNKCYNPWCAYSDGYNCPIPPVQNQLELEVLAGEKNFAGEKKH